MYQVMYVRGDCYEPGIKAPEVTIYEIHVLIFQPIFQLSHYRSHF